MAFGLMAAVAEKREARRSRWPSAEQNLKNFVSISRSFQPHLWCKTEAAEEGKKPVCRQCNNMRYSKMRSNIFSSGLSAYFLGNCDIDFFNFCHHQVWNFNISNQSKWDQNFAFNFQKHRKQTQKITKYAKTEQK